MYEKLYWTSFSKRIGLRYDLTQGLPGDDDFSKQFVKKQLEIIDTFDVK